jgi:outer membrane protein TolC
MLYLRILMLVFIVQHAVAQGPLTIESCYELALANHPMEKQRTLISAAEDYSVANVAKGRLPQLFIGGQATYQSDVTQIPVSIPGQEILVLDKDQYRLYGEVVQPLTDLIQLREQENAQLVAPKVEMQSLEVDLYKIRSRIDQLYFGVLLLDEQLKQTHILMADIEIALKRSMAMLANGSELQRNVDLLNAEYLSAKQRLVNLSSARSSYLGVLSEYIQTPLNDSAQLLRPAPPEIDSALHRPELELFSYQRNSLEVQDRLLSARNVPKLSLFVQGGVGRPTPVNLLSNEIQSYYIAGVRLSWSISSLYTSANERKLLEVSRRAIDVQEETFRLNTNIELIKISEEISRLKKVLQDDDEIVALREAVRAASMVQQENGVITASDDMRELNAIDRARQDRAIHEIELLAALYNYHHTAGTTLPK